VEIIACYGEPMQEGALTSFTVGYHPISSFTAQ